MEQGTLAKESANATAKATAIKENLEKCERQLKLARFNEEQELKEVTNTIEKKMGLLELRVHELEDLREEVRHKLGEIEFLEHDILAQWGISRVSYMSSDNNSSSGMPVLTILHERQQNLEAMRNKRKADGMDKRKMRNEIHKRLRKSGRKPGGIKHHSESPDLKFH